MNTRARISGKGDPFRVDKKDYMLLYSNMDPSPFDWEYLNRNSSQALIQMCYCLGLPVNHKGVVKSELVNLIKKHLYPPKTPAPQPKPAVGAAAAAMAAAAAQAAANKEKELEKEEKKRLKTMMTKALPPFSGRNRLDQFQYPNSDDQGNKKKLGSKIYDTLDEDVSNLFSSEKIPSTAIIIQRGGTTMYAEENDDENRVAYDEASIEGEIIEKITKLIMPKKKSAKSLGTIYSIVYLWLNMFLAIFIVFYIVFWKKT